MTAAQLLACQASRATDLLRAEKQQNCSALLFLVVFLDIFRVTGRIIISRECGWHTGRIFKNVKSVPDLYKRVEQTHKSVSECQHD